MRNFYYVFLFFFKLSLCSSQAFDVQNVMVNGVSASSGTLTLPANTNVTLYFEIDYSTYALSNGTYYVGIRTPNSSKYDYGAYYSTLASGDVPSNTSNGHIPVSIIINTSNYTNGAILGGYLQIYNYGFLYPTEKIISIQTQTNTGITNNIISGNQTINSGEIPSTLNGTTPQGGGGIYNYYWERKVIGGTGRWNTVVSRRSDYENQTKDYQPGMITQSTMFRRRVVAGSYTSYSNIIEINISQGGFNNYIAQDHSEILNISDDLSASKSVEIFQISPNPVINGVVKIHHQFADYQLNETHINIYNLNGILIYSRKLDFNNEVDVSNIEKGIYVIKLHNGEMIETKKIIIN